MIVLDEWKVVGGFEMEGAFMALGSRIHTAGNGMNWAIVRKFRGMGKIRSDWHVLRSYTDPERAREQLRDLEQGMRAKDFETYPMSLGESPYDGQSGFGVF